MKAQAMQRYFVSQFDGSTFIVIDHIEQREICICENCDDWVHAEKRANRIALLLNDELTNSQNQEDSMSKKKYDIIRIPSDDWETIMETVTLDGSYSEEIKKDIWKAIENVEFITDAWVVVTIDESKNTRAFIFSSEKTATAYKHKLTQDGRKVITANAIYK